MPLSSDIIIADTSCLILLGKIDELDLLSRMGRKVCVTSMIHDEYGKPLPEWISIIDPEHLQYLNILKMDLDEGEASAIALSLETENAILILDELKARKVAERLSLKYSGTFGLILGAKQAGVIKSVRPVLDKIRSTNFRFSDDLLEAVLKEAGES